MSMASSEGQQEARWGGSKHKYYKDNEDSDSEDQGLQHHEIQQRINQHEIGLEDIY